MYKSVLVFIVLILIGVWRVSALCSPDIFKCSEKLNKNRLSALDEGPSKGFIADFRQKSSDNIRHYLPSPHSELLLGMTIGINDLKYVPKFNKFSKVTGTVHVVVVSGYNISLVFGLVIGLVGSQYKMRNLIIALSATLFYAVISGFEPPVIRAWVMGSIAAWGKYYGRSLDGAKLLFFSGLIMILYQPEFLFSLSFQLSFMATLSLCMFSDPISKLIRSFFGKTKSFLVEDLVSTLSAQILVWPLISNSFGTISVISPVVNPLILWSVPISTVLGIIMLFLTFISTLLSRIFIYVVFVPLDIYVRIVSWFGNLKWASLNIELSTTLMLIYYLIVFVWCICLYRR